jgi:hypothetical protein
MLQESDHGGHDDESMDYGEWRARTMALVLCNRSRTTAHDEDVHDAVSSHESATGLHPKGTVTTYNAYSPEATN